MGRLHLYMYSTCTIMIVYYMHGVKCMYMYISNLPPDPEQDLQLSLTPLDPSLSPGHSVSLSCSVAEPADLSWSFQDGPLPANSVVTPHSSGLASVLVISGAVLENAGAYTCRANNTARGVVNEDTSYVAITGEGSE